MPSLGLGRLLTWERVDPTARRPRGAGTSTFWIFSIGSATLLFMGWLLPWFVRPTSSGIGYSPMDVVSSAPTGIGTFLVYLLGIGMLVMMLSPFAELFYRARKRAVPARLDQVRVLIAVLGLVFTVVVFLLTRVIQEEQLFGPIDAFTITDSAVWLTMVGYILAAAAYGLRGWVIRRPTKAFAAIALPVGILLPLMFHQAPVFILWAAGSLGIYTLLALGLNVVVGFAGLLDLGYAAFFAIGAYTCGSLASPKHSIHLPLWVLIFLGAAVASMFGAVLGAPTLRLRGDYLAIVTLGFGEITRIFLNNLNAPINLTNGPQGISRIDPINVAGISLNTTQAIFGITFPSVHLYFYLFLAFTALVIFVSQRLEKSRIGRAWMAIREDEIAASAMGINTRNLKLLAFAMGAMFGGASGALFAGFQGFVSPESFSLMESIMVLCMVVLGGMGNIAGVILGGVLLALLPEVLRHSVVPLQQVLFGKTLVDPESLRMLLFGGALIVMMLYRPAGLLPSRVRRRELDGDETTAEASVYDATH